MTWLLAVAAIVVLFLISPTAALVAIGAAVIAVLVVRFSVDTAFEGWAGIQFLGAWIGSRRRARGVAGLDWFCARCRSLNPPSADACYRGCGPRAETELGGSYALPLEPSAGRNQRDRRHG